MDFGMGIYLFRKGLCQRSQMHGYECSRGAEDPALRGSVREGSVVTCFSSGVLECWSAGVLEEKVMRIALLVARKKQRLPKSQYIPKFFVHCFYNTPWPRPTTKVRVIYQPILIYD